MIYAGTETNSEGVDTTIGQSKYNGNAYNDHTYAGYMYGKNFAFKEGTNAIEYKNFDANTKYYFGSSYEFDEDTKKFSIIGEYLYVTWQDNYEEIIANYPYICKGASISNCYYIMKIEKYKNSSTMIAKYISYSSINYDSVLTNDNSSTIKQVVDEWYEDNILNVTDRNNNLYSDYLNFDATFCNDRSVFSGNGYDIQITTHWNDEKRIEKFTPSLKCEQFADTFTSTTSTLGNK